MVPQNVSHTVSCHLSSVIGPHRGLRVFAVGLGFGTNLSTRSRNIGVVMMRF
jgi:hypothetical protein